MYLLRAAAPGDLDDLVALSAHLDSVNLPNDRARLAEVLERSTKSFEGSIDRARREFLFVLEERTPGRTRVVGSSLIFAQHGSRRAPHVYFDVLEEERYSETLDRHFHHRVLRLGFNYQGLTEIGGLVLLPELRRHAEQLGRSLSYVRFMFIAENRALFRDEIVSELMPPLESDGTSLLWEALGRNFTGLTYQEADRLSRENKEFIKALFPQEPIYACLLPPRAQALIGQVGERTKGVERMLRRIGFHYADRIDPFDGGPHFHARTDDVTLVRAARTLRVGRGEAGSSEDAETAASATPRPAVLALVSVSSPAAPFFRAVRTYVSLTDSEVGLLPADASALGVRAGDRVGLLPLDDSP